MNRGGKRPGAGRPRVYHTPLETVAVRVDRAQLADLATKLGASESETIRFAVEALHKYLSGRDQTE